MVHTAGLLLALAIGQAVAVLQPAFVEDVKKASPGSRIVSGWDAQPGQIPFQASLRMVSTQGLVYGCGASVVHTYWLVSAAHCTVHPTVIVRAGLTSQLRPEYMYETTEWYNYPTYDASSTMVQPDDISLIKLIRPLTYSDMLQPVRIQPRAEAHNNYDRQVMIASGFGVTWTSGFQSETLQWVYLVATSNDACARLYGTTLINDRAICAGFYNVTSQSTCSGDSGGPLFYHNEENKPVLVGVASFVAGGDFGCHSGLPAGFIRAGPYHDWFQEITGIDFDNLVEEQTTTTGAPQTTTTAAPQTTTTGAPQTTTTEAPQTTTSLAPTLEPDEDDDDDDDDDSSEVDPEIAELLKKIIVKVKVKVNINDEVKKKVKVKCVHHM